MSALSSSDNVKAKSGIGHVAVIITLLGAVAGLGMGLPGLIADTKNLAAAEKVAMGAISLYHVVESIKYFKLRKALRLAKEAAEKGK